jgi:hypothetical protein
MQCNKKNETYSEIYSLNQSVTQKGMGKSFCEFSENFLPKNEQKSK